MLDPAKERSPEYDPSGTGLASTSYAPDNIVDQPPAAALNAQTPMQPPMQPESGETISNSVFTANHTLITLYNTPRLFVKSLDM